MLTVNGIPLRAFNYAFSSYSGLRGSPRKRLGSTEVPGVNGVLPSLSMNSFGPNEVALTMWVAGDSCGRQFSSELAAQTTRRAKYNTTLDMLFHLFAPLGQLLDLRQEMGDGTTRQAYVRVSESISPDVTAFPTGTFNVLLEIPAVFWQDVDNSTFLGAASAASPHNIEVTPLTGATAPIEDATYLVYGPAASGVRLSCPDNGGWVRLNRALSAAEAWRINSEAFESAVGTTGMGLDGAYTTDAIALTEYAGSGARLLTMQPTSRLEYVSNPNIAAMMAANRTARLVLSGSGFGATTRVTVRARRKFL